MTEMRRVDVSRLVAEAPFGSHQIAIVAICFIVNILEGFDAQVVAFVVSDISNEWDVPREAFTVALAASIAGMMVGFPLLGFLSDRFGRKAVLLPSLFAVGMLTLAATQASNVQQLTAVRFLVGVGLSGMTLALYAIASEFAPQKYRAAVIVMVVTGFPLGGALGGLVTTSVVAEAGWRAAIALPALLSTISIPFVWAILPESVEFLAVRKASPQKISRTLSRLTRTFTPAEGDYFVSSSSSNSGLVRDLFSHGRAVGTISIWLIFMLGFFVMFCLFSWLPTILRDSGYELGEAMNGNAFYNIGGIVGGLALGPLLDRVSARRVLPSAYFVAAIVLGILAFTSPHQIVLFGLFFALGFLLPGGFTGLIASTSTFYPISIRAVGIGWAQSMGRLGGIIGASAGGVMIGQDLHMGQIFGVLALPCAAAGAITLVYTSRLSRTSETGRIESRGMG